MTTANDNAASVRSTISRKKLAANRRNARKSTGPRTDEGKRAASMNASSHGIFCRDLILRGESRAEFISLWNSCQMTLRADNGVEFALLNRYVQSVWRLLRVQAADAALHEEALERIESHVQRKIARLQQKEQEIERFAEPQEIAGVKENLGRMRFLAELNALNKTPAGPILAGSMNHQTSGPRERLNRYEQRIESGGMRALGMLLKLREQMKKHPNTGPCLFLIDPEEADDDAKLEATLEKLQNEPTEAEPAASDAPAEGCDATSCDTGAPPVHSAAAISTGETPVSQRKQETIANVSRQASD